MSLLGCTQPIPDEASHPNFPRIQSKNYAEHVDQLRACSKTREHSKNAAEKTENAECADGQTRKKTEKAENREGRAGQGWLWVTWICAFQVVKTPHESKAMAARRLHPPPHPLHTKKLEKAAAVPTSCQARFSENFDDPGNFLSDMPGLKTFRLGVPSMEPYCETK